MLFNSIVFLFFFLIVYLVFWHTPQRGRKYWLLFASIVFYGYWDWRFLIHFCAVVLINYLFVRLLLNERRRHIYYIAIGLNLLNLIFFKYTNSFLTIIGQDLNIPSALAIKENLGLILPLAISFYTFQIIAFITDLWRGEIKETNFVKYAVFIMFFPQLISGPIMRHHEFLGQIDHAKLTNRDIPAGLYLLMLGLTKKVLIADEIAAVINPIWMDPAKYDSIAGMAATIGFVAQVYCDFSGYTDMARGQARLLGYRIPENFFSPYLSTSFAEIWKRWHVTLSRWLRDYLYFPLGGSRVGKFRMYLNILIVMSLGGLWHGNTYTFFLWGFIHGMFLLIEKWFGAEKPASTWKMAILRNLLVMFCWTIATNIFRAPDLKTAYAIFYAIFSNNGDAVRHCDLVFQLSAVALALQWLQRYRHLIEMHLKKHWKIIIPIMALTLYYLIIRIERPAEEFIYFQF